MAAAGITRRIIEAELDEHLGAGAEVGGRNRRRGKKIATEVDPVHAAVPRDRNGSFAPAVVHKSDRTTQGTSEMAAWQGPDHGRGLHTSERAFRGGDLQGNHLGDH
jgi:hypothetical protein